MRDWMWTILVGAMCSTAAAGNEERLIASTARRDLFFGRTLSSDGTRALFGCSPSADEVLCFENDGSQWQETQVIVPSDGTGSDAFRQVSHDGDRAAIGARRHDTADGTDRGAVYLAEHDGAQWVEAQKLTRSDSFWLGKSVALSGDVVVIGANADTFEGEAHFYRYDGSVWNHEQTFTNPSQDYAGNVAILGDVALVASASEDSGGFTKAGRVYVYRFDGSQWSESQVLEASDPPNSAYFSIGGISLDGEFAVIGQSNLSVGFGGAYVFHDVGGVFVEEQKLTAAADRWDQFGFAVSISDDVIVVGAAYFGPNGGAFVFHYDGRTWRQQDVLQPRFGAGGPQFGRSVDVDDDQILVGAPGMDNDGGRQAGVAYAFRKKLLLESDLDVAFVGDNLELQVSGGLAGAPVLLWVPEIDTTPTGLIVLISQFDGAGEISLGGVVPPSLAGGSVRFQALGVVTPGDVDCSYWTTVHFE